VRDHLRDRVTTAVPGSTQGLQLVVDDTGRPDPDWPDWYARYMVADSAAPGTGA